MKLVVLLAAIAAADLPQDIGAGVVDVKSFHRESAEEVAGRLR